jgi:hypothetical protein
MTSCNRQGDKEVRGPLGKWGHLGCWGRWGTRPAGGERGTDSRLRTVKEVRRFKMLEGTGDELGTTSSHPYAQSMYCMCIMCNNPSCSQQL